MKKQPHKLFGLVGYPIGHSLSPNMHNAAFNKLNINAAYLPFQIKPNKLREGIDALVETGVSGFNVTIPFKSKCIKYLDSVEPVAREIGAVNTVVVKSNKLIGYNTDYLGFLKSLKEDLKFSPRKKRALILGAGGAARAICFGLCKESVRSVYIYDIVDKKAEQLALSAKESFEDIEIVSCQKKDIKDIIKGVDLVVNCTPLGMNKKDSLPIDKKLLHRKLKLYDIVYNPLETALVKAAKSKGIKAVGGLNMLLYQGALAFELWTGKKAPINLMRKELLGNLI